MKCHIHLAVSMTFSKRFKSTFTWYEYTRVVPLA